MEGDEYDAESKPDPDAAQQDGDPDPQDSHDEGAYRFDDWALI